MATTKEDISQWFDEGVKKGATHMLVVTDTFDYEDYPKYVMSGEDPRARYKEYLDGTHSMQTVMEVYCLKQDVITKESQLAEKRAQAWRFVVDGLQGDGVTEFATKLLEGKMKLVGNESGMEPQSWHVEETLMYCLSWASRGVRRPSGSCCA